MKALKANKKVYKDEIKAFNEVILRTRNFQIIQNSCKAAMDHKQFIGLSGEAGYGKTVALQYFKEKNPNVFIVTASPSMQGKLFWVNILEKVGGTSLKKGPMFDYKHRPQYYIIKSICEIFNSMENPLLIIDEAGKLSARMLLDLHDLRDSTRMGFIISGPSYFKLNLQKWIVKHKQGIGELYSRINNWIELDKPTPFEMKKICESRGITDINLIKELLSESIEFRSLSSRISNYLIDNS